MKRLPQILLILTFLAFSWLAMQAVHELGHVLAAWVTGGEVARVVLVPWEISRTELAPSGNPHPLAVVWAGPLMGVVAPLLFYLILLGASVAPCFGLGRASAWLYLPRFFAGFCLIANGGYIGTAWLLTDGGDATAMTRHGSPVWLLIAFGTLTAAAGLYLWHGQGTHFGLGDARGKVNGRAAAVSAGLFVVIVAAELVCTTNH